MYSNGSGSSLSRTARGFAVYKEGNTENLIFQDVWSLIGSKAYDTDVHGAMMALEMILLRQIDQGNSAIYI